MAVLFPNIFHDPMAYLDAETLLRRLFDRIKCEDYQGPMWTEWMTTTGNDGTRIYDEGMPVYTQVCEARRKGIVIWLKDPKEMEGYGFQPEIFFAAETPVRDMEVEKVACLDITCVLSDENLERIESLIRIYIVSDVTPDALSAALHDAKSG